MAISGELLPGEVVTPTELLFVRVIYHDAEDEVFIIPLRPNEEIEYNGQSALDLDQLYMFWKYETLKNGKVVRHKIYLSFKQMQTLVRVA